MNTHWLTRYIDFTPPSACFAEGDTGGDAGGGTPPAPSGTGGDSGGDGTPPAATPNWGEFVNSLGALNESLGGKLDTLVSEVRTVATPPAQSAEPPDFEAMSRPELVAHIVGTVGEAVRAQIEAALSPITTQLTGLQTTVATKTATEQVKELRSTHKDFNDWKDEMVGLARQPQYASLEIADLYVLARSRNASKASALDLKYTPPAPKPAPRWGGLTPSGGGTSNGAAVLSAADAGREAYREVSARHPGVLAVLEGL